MNFQFAARENKRPFRPYRYDPEPPSWHLLDSIDWERLSVIEVGAGKGAWITTQAQKNPHINYIGIERSHNRSKILLRKANELNLPNLTVLRADATALINQKVPQETVAELVFFYPNPIPKKRQANRRFFVGSAFRVYHDCLKPGGRIYVATNIPDYLKEARDSLVTKWGYKILRFGALPRDLPPRTEFEAKYQIAGNELFELVIEKSG